MKMSKPQVHTNSYAHRYTFTWFSTLRLAKNEAKVCMKIYIVNFVSMSWRCPRWACRARNRKIKQNKSMQIMHFMRCMQSFLCNSACWYKYVLQHVNKYVFLVILSLHAHLLNSLLITRQMRWGVMTSVG